MSTAPATIAEPIAHLAIPIDQLHHDPSNARVYSDRNIEAIKSSLAMFGQIKPVVVQRAGMIVRAGNGTLAAARTNGDSTMPTIATFAAVANARGVTLE